MSRNIKILLLLLVLIIVILLNIFCNPYNLHLNNTEVISLESQLNKKKNKELPNNCTTFYHLQILGGNDEGEELTVFAIATESTFYIADNGQLMDEIDKFERGIPCILYVHKNDHQLNLIKMEMAEDDEGQRNENIPAVVLGYAKLRSLGMHYFSHYEHDKELAQSILLK